MYYERGPNNNSLSGSLVTIHLFYIIEDDFSLFRFPIESELNILRVIFFFSGLYLTEMVITCFCVLLVPVTDFVSLIVS